MSSASGPTEEVVRLVRPVDAPSPNLPGDERVFAAVAPEAPVELGLPRPRVLTRSERRPNLLATLEFPAGGRHLCLAGHLDAKPIGDARWSVPSDRSRSVDLYAEPARTDCGGTT